MKRPAGLVIIASVLFLAGLRMLGGPAGSDDLLVVRITVAIVGILSIVAAYGLWTRRDYAMKAYWLWVLAWLVGGGVVQYVAGGLRPAHVVIWWIFVGAVWLAVGIHLKSALKEDGR
jgi:hypothetical protein